jgi:hypothetical protein
VIDKAKELLTKFGDNKSLDFNTEQHEPKKEFNPKRESGETLGGNV